MCSLLLFALFIGSSALPLCPNPLNKRTMGQFEYQHHYHSRLEDWTCKQRSIAILHFNCRAPAGQLCPHYQSEKWFFHKHTPIKEEHRRRMDGGLNCLYTKVCQSIGDHAMRENQDFYQFYDAHDQLDFANEYGICSNLCHVISRVLLSSLCK